MSTEDIQIKDSENSDKLPQIQEKTVSSNTEESIDKQETDEKAVTNGHKPASENVQASDNPVVDEEKKNSTEAIEEKEDSSKAENVTSTEEGPTTEVKNPDSKTGDEEKKNEDQAQQKDGDGLGTIVAKHYNEIQAGSKEGRKDSRIFYLRNFNNWVKSVMINEYLEKIKRKKRTSDVVNVLDLACGKGGDLLKWQKGKVDHVIMADIAATSIEHCNERYSKLEKDSSRYRHSRDRLFTVETYAADCTKELLKDKYKNSDIKLDLTSCQFAYHYSFESYEQADMMLRNACENLQVGGYFIGTTPDAQKLVKRIKGCKADSFGNSVFNIKPEDKENFPLFGAKYMFYLEGVVECPEFVVYMPAMEKLAEKYNMKLVWKKNFHDLFKQYERQYSSLLLKMNAMEHYPAKENKTLSGGSESQYKSAKDFIDSENGKYSRVGTLSADEWDVAGLYLAFAFEKIAPPREGRSDERGNRKRHHEDRSRSESNKSRDRHSHRDRRKTSESSTKRSKKDTETEEVYEVKDEIYEDEGEKVETETTIVSTKSDETEAMDNSSVTVVTSTEEPTAGEEASSTVTEVEIEETGAEAAGNNAEAEEIAEEATEETTE